MTQDLMLSGFTLRPIVEAALREDIRSGDVTSDALVPANLRGQAQINARDAGVICGLELARIAFELLDPDCHFSSSVFDGDTIVGGMTLLGVQGPARAILTGERVALNFVQRMSGIATLTRHFVDAVAGHKASIADTRKTTPGLRLLEKYAVRCGGGSNHRFALDDLVLIKDNHIALCGGIAQAVQRARQRVGHAMKIEVECDTLEQVGQAADAGVDIILLDNMSNDQLSTAVALIAGRALAEASGGITLPTVAGVAATGVDIISVGALTHSARSLDIGLDIALVDRQ